VGGALLAAPSTGVTVWIGAQTALFSGGAYIGHPYCATSNSIKSFEAKDGVYLNKCH
jgi:hypothetical protein